MKSVLDLYFHRKAVTAGIERQAILKSWLGQLTFFLEKQRGVPREESREKVQTLLKEIDEYFKQSGIPDVPEGNWIIKNITSGNLIWPEDAEKTKNLIKRFNEAKKSGNFDGPRAIQEYESFGDLVETVERNAPKPKQQVQREQATEGTEELSSNLIKITTPEAASSLCKGTEWCVKDPRWSMEYLFQGPLYMISKGGEPYVLFHIPSGSIKDVYDNPISLEIAEEVKDIVQSVSPNFGWLSRDFIVFLNYTSEQFKLDVVQQDGEAIQYIENPSEQLQLEAVKRNGWAIQHIKNPSEQVQLEAVRQNGWAIQHIKNPSEQVQLVAVKQSGDAIQHIKNPSEQVQLAAVRQNGEAIELIENPSEQVQLEAAKYWKRRKLGGNV
jgi:hypothetical protein